MENGMESSRGGPLTTFIMTLPLIVVPAIAMLKPVDSGSGLVSSVLSAASGRGDSVGEASATDSNSEAPDFASVQDEFDAVFGESDDAGELDTGELETGELETGELETGELETGEQAFQEDVGESLVDDFAADFGTPASPSDFAAAPATAPAESGSDGDLEPLLSQLTNMGAARTLWFSPDGTTVGFVAFFPTGPGTVSYRFEAMAASKSAAVRDVLRQAAAWRESSGQ